MFFISENEEYMKDSYKILLKGLTKAESVNFLFRLNGSNRERMFLKGVLLEFTRM